MCTTLLCVMLCIQTQSGSMLCCVIVVLEAKANEINK